MSNAEDFTGKVVIITGSTSGIGEGIAIYLSKLGANVVITGRSEQNVKRVADICQSVSPKRLKALEVIADITNEEDVKRLIDTTVTVFGQIDVLVNNAGAIWPTSIDDSDLMQTYDKTMNLDIRSVVYVTHLSVPYLLQTKGNIINISSVAALKPLYMAMPYSVAKAALDMFTKCLAVELGPKGVRVNAINCGAVKSNIGVDFGLDKVLEESGNATPLGIFGSPQHIASVVAFFASRDASFITGATLIADSGALLSNADLKLFYSFNNTDV